MRRATEYRHRPEHAHAREHQREQAECNARSREGAFGEQRPVDHSLFRPHAHRGNGGVQSDNGSLQRAHHRVGTAVDAHMDRHRRGVTAAVLKIWEVDRRRGSVSQASVFRVADDADDRGHGSTILERTAHGVDAVKVRIHEPAVDDDRARRGGAIGPAQQPAGNQRDADRLEELRADPVSPELQLRLRRRRVGKVPPALGPTRSDQAVLRETDGANAGHRADLALQVLVVRSEPRVRVSVQPRLDLQRHEVLRVEAEFHPLEANERGGKQPGADEERQTERHLRANEHFAGARRPAPTRRCPIAS